MTPKTKWQSDGYEHSTTNGKRKVTTFRNSIGFEVHLIIDGVHAGHYRKGGMLYRDARHDGFDTLKDAKQFGETLLNA